MGPLLVDQGSQLGVADEATLLQVTVRVVVVQDRHRKHIATAIGAVAGDASIQAPLYGAARV